MSLQRYEPAVQEALREVSEFLTVEGVRHAFGDATRVGRWTEVRIVIGPEAVEEMRLGPGRHDFMIRYPVSMPLEVGTDVRLHIAAAVREAAIYDPVLGLLGPRGLPRLPDSLPPPRHRSLHVDDD